MVSKIARWAVEAAGCVGIGMLIGMVLREAGAI